MPSYSKQSPTYDGFVNPAERYRIVGRIAAGGMAEIYLARMTTSTGQDREVVLKRLLPELQSDHEFVQMFHDEARIACQLNHPNIVQIFELGELDGSLFIAMELLRGVNLRDILARLHTANRPLPIPLAVRICCEALSGLHYAHSFSDARGRKLNVVHRDVSPQNMLVTYEGTVKLVDFGVAKAEGKLHQTRAGLVKGKFAYMSPEQITGAPLDGRSDIFALAEVFYELLVRRHPFYAATDMDVLRAILDSEPAHPSSLDPSFPRSLGDIFMKALRKKPGERYADAAAMQDALEHFLLEQRTPATSIALGRFLREIFSDRMKMEQQARERGDDDLLIEAMTAGRAEYVKSMGKGAIPRLQTGDLPPPGRDLISDQTPQPARPPQNGASRGARDIPKDNTGERLKQEVRGLFSEEEDLPTSPPTPSPLSSKGKQKRPIEEDAAELPTMLGKFTPEQLAEMRGAARPKQDPPVVAVEPGPVRPVVQRAAHDPADIPTTLPSRPEAREASPALVQPVAQEETTARGDRFGILFFIAGLGALIGAILYAVMLLSEPTAPMMALMIESTPSNGHVFIDGADIGATTPVRIPEIAADRAHVVEVKLPGYETCTKTVEPVGDSVVAERKVPCMLTPVPSAP